LILTRGAPFWSSLRADPLGALASRSRALLALAILLTGIAASVSVSDLVHDGGVDLRSRVMAAKALLSGFDPYRPETLLYPGPNASGLVDPSSTDPVIARATYAPTVVLLYGLFDRLDYRAQRFIWGGLEWLALLASIAVAARSMPQPDQRRLMLAVFLLFFACSSFWRLHVERGQYYAFVALLLALDIAPIVKGTRAKFAGIGCGVAAALRPDLAVLIPILWAGGKKRAAAQAAAAAGLVLLLALPAASIGIWQSYAANIGRLVDWMAGPRNRAAFPVVDTHGPIDGYMFTNWLHSSTESFTLPSLIHARGIFGVAAALTLLTCVALVTLAHLSRRCRMPGLALGALLAWTPALLDMFLPLRQSYADVLFLLGLVPAVLIAERQRSLALALLLVLFLETCARFWDVYSLWVLRILVYESLMAAAICIALRTSPAPSVRP
jgi:hypothetical protein